MNQKDRETPAEYAARREEGRQDASKRLRITLAAQLLSGTDLDVLDTALLYEGNHQVSDARAAVRCALVVADLLIEEADK